MRNLCCLGARGSCFRFISDLGVAVQKEFTLFLLNAMPSLRCARRPVDNAHVLSSTLVLFPLSLGSTSCRRC